MTHPFRILFLLPLIFFCLAFLPAGTAVLSGTVKDAQTGKAIAGAKVELYKSGKVTASTSSDGNGFYEFKNLTATTYAVVGSFSAYKSVTTAAALTEGKTRTVNLSLQPVNNVNAVVSVKDESIKNSNVNAVATGQGTSPAVAGDKKASEEISYKRKAPLHAEYSKSVTYSHSYSTAGAYAPAYTTSSYNSVSTVTADPYTANTGYHATIADSVNNTESYDKITDNPFRVSQHDPLSTFSIDVDRASYTMMRRYINSNQLPPKDAVRIEEMVNYFSYDYPQPQNSDPFTINTEMVKCPWNTGHQLVQIGLQGRDMDASQLPPSNLVFLIDVSGSMGSANKLPLVKSALNMLIDRIRPQDMVTIVVYAGAAGEVLAPTAGTNKQAMRDAINNLSSGGSTAGGAGIELAYKRAVEHYVQQGNNRVILATDGDFNVGVSSEDELEKLIEEKRKSGVYLTVLGFGMGNYKDSKLERLADKGNGNYAYIDNAQEAEKVFVKEFGGTLFAIAKDVKLQIEFNPSQVKAYRLIGYENRMLNKEDFNDDKKDAGELGCGHTVTALYEIIPAGSDEKIPGVDSLKYQTASSLTSAAAGDEMMTVKFRYKEPSDSVSKLIVHPLKGKAKDYASASENLRWSSSVAEFGMLLRDSPYKSSASFEHVISTATAAKGKDTDGYRAEFIKLAETAKKLKDSTSGTTASSGGTH